MTISTDGTNHFIGSGYRGSSTLAIAQTEISQLLTNALGGSNFVIEPNNRVFDWRPNIAEEMYTGTIQAITSNLAHPNSGNPGNYARFSQSYNIAPGTTNQIITRLNTNNSNNNLLNNEIFTQNTGNVATNNDLTVNCWITANERSVATFLWNESASYYLFTWCGVTVDNIPGFDTYPANCCTFMVASSPTANSANGVRAANFNSTNPQTILTTNEAQYSITCNDTQTPSGTWTSDFWLVDDDAGSGNPASGRCQNLLLAEGSSLAIGTMHDLATANQDPGSNAYLCVAEWGSKFILMRVNV